MSNVYRLPNSSESIEQAGARLARIDRGLSTAEEEAMREWLDSNERNLESLLQVAELWDRMDSLSRLSDLFPVPDTPTVRLPLVAVAASLVAIFALSIGVWAPWEPTLMDEVIVETVQQTTIFETGTGEQSTISLADGSH